MSNHFWTVVLAAGAGSRLAAVTGGVPKQFWRGANGVSLLDQTLHRFSTLAPASRTVVIVDAAHRHYVSSGAVVANQVVHQPCDRGTAAGVLLALTRVLDADPDAMVAITPSDHGVADDRLFRRSVREAAQYAESNAAVVIFGAQPDEAHHDYGWITPEAARSADRFRPVADFVEKPSPERAARLFEAGAVWNTMVLVGKARAVQGLYAALLPALSEVFETGRGLPPAERERFFATVYPSLPRFDFSRDLIAAAPRLLTRVWPASMGWTDLGTPERLDAWQRRSPAGCGAASAVTAA